MDRELLAMEWVSRGLVALWLLIPVWVAACLIFDGMREMYWPAVILPIPLYIGHHIMIAWARSYLKRSEK